MNTSNYQESPKRKYTVINSNPETPPCIHWNGKQIADEKLKGHSHIFVERDYDLVVGLRLKLYDQNYKYITKITIPK